MTNWKEQREDAAYVAELSDMCRNYFKLFCIYAFKYVYKKKFIWSDHHTEIEKALMRVWTGKTRNLIINIPPRYSKTELICLFSAWAFAHNPLCEFLHLSYSSKLACKNSNKVRGIIKSQWFQDCFKVEINPNIDSIGEWATKEGGIFKADSSGGQVTGFGAGATNEYDKNGEFIFFGCILIDDPLKPSDAHTVERKKVNENWHETIKSRRNSPSSTPTICIMQRLHEDDFTAELERDEAESFDKLCMKALKDDGTALWPKMHSVEDLELMMKTNIYVFSGQYQQAPTPAGGSIFKRDWWPIVFKFPDTFRKVIITADTALTEKETSDYSVFQCWGLHENKIYLLDQVRGKWESPDLLDVACNFINRMKTAFPNLREAHIENKASGTGLIQTLKRISMISIRPVERSRDKISRANDIATYIQSGQVVPVSGTAYHKEFIDECTSFTATNTHKNDDQIDPMMDAIEVLLVQSNSGILAI